MQMLLTSFRLERYLIMAATKNGWTRKMPIRIVREDD